MSTSGALSVAGRRDSRGGRRCGRGDPTGGGSPGGLPRLVVGAARSAPVVVEVMPSGPRGLRSSTASRTAQREPRVALAVMQVMPGYRHHSCGVEGRRVAGRGSVARPALSRRASVRTPWARFLPRALRTRRADFRHRAFQWNHAARTRVPGPGPCGRTSRAMAPQTRPLPPAGRCVVSEPSISRTPWLSFGFQERIRSRSSMPARLSPASKRTRARPIAARRNGRFFDPGPLQSSREVLRQRLHADAHGSFAGGGRFLQTVRLAEETSPGAPARRCGRAPARPARSAGGAFPAASPCLRRALRAARPALSVVRSCDSGKWNSPYSPSVSKCTAISTPLRPLAHRHPRPRVPC